MNLAETTELLEWLSAMDGTEVTVEKVKGWTDVIGYLSFEQAKEAAIEAKKEIQFVQPHNIISIAAQNDRKAGRSRMVETTKALIADQERASKNSSPMPQCVHGKGLLRCDPCCRNAAIQAGLIKPN